LKIKLKGHHFDTSEVIEAESQMVLNARTEHYFQDAIFKKSRNIENGAYTHNGTTWRVMVASRPIVIF
jgi:hypothetical protein